MVPNHQPVYIIYISYIPSNIPTMVGYKSHILWKHQSHVPNHQPEFHRNSGMFSKRSEMTARMRRTTSTQKPLMQFLPIPLHLIHVPLLMLRDDPRMGQQRTLHLWDCFGPIDTVGGKTQMDLGTTFPWKRANRLDQGNSLRSVRELLPRSEPAETPGLSWSSDGECLGYFAVLDSILFHMAEANKLLNQDLLGNSVKTFKRLVKEMGIPWS